MSWGGYALKLDRPLSTLVKFLVVVSAGRYMQGYDATVIKHLVDESSVTWSNKDIWK